MALLEFDSESRWENEAARAPYGKIISEALEQFLGHHWPEIEKRNPASAASVSAVKKRLTA